MLPVPRTFTYLHKLVATIMLMPSGETPPPSAMRESGLGASAVFLSLRAKAVLCAAACEPESEGVWMGNGRGLGHEGDRHGKECGEKGEDDTFHRRASRNIEQCSCHLRDSIPLLQQSGDQGANRAPS